MGSSGGLVSIQAESRHIFWDVLLQDEKLQLPSGTKEAAKRTKFDEDAISTPFLPTPIKMTEAITSLWALAATIANVMCKERYDMTQDVVINSDAATLFLMSSATVKVGGKTLQDKEIARRYIPYDKGGMFKPWRRLATNIYPTKDGRWYHLHASMNADPVLTMLGLEKMKTDGSEKEIIDTYSRQTKQHTSDWWDIEANEHFRQAGTVCLTPEEYLRSDQGRAVKDDGLYILEKVSSGETPVPWPSTSSSAAKRPLEGIKIIDISRVIAAPTITKLAALFGATVIRISCDSQPDMGPLLVDGNLGKRDVTLDLKKPEGKKALQELLQDADVILDGYRPGALERLGFGPVYVTEMARRRGRGIVYVRENCYGWSGPMAHRSGWQQISDCITGVSWLQGQFLGLEEPVVPLLPNSDYQAGMAGFIGVLCALNRRHVEGGSYLLSVSLNYINSFLLSLKVQPEAVQRQLRAMHPNLHLRHYDDMIRLVAKTLTTVSQASPQLFHPRHFDTIKAHLGGPEDETMTFVGPAATFTTTKLQYDVGSCFLGAYEAKWPES